MKYSIIIPARYASSRFPGKPMIDLAGKSMLQRVYEQACLSQAQQVYIATDDQRIFSHSTQFCANVLMTASKHLSGTDRLQEVVTQLDLPDDEIIVNVQGDEPFVAVDSIEQVAGLLESQSDASVATLYEPIKDVTEFLNPNCVKVVNAGNVALYFSRAPIPFSRDDIVDGLTYLPKNLQAKRHVGMYAYRVKALHQFVQYAASSYELTESLEQLRFLENQCKIVIAASEVCSVAGIDTPEDVAWALEKIESLS